MLGFAFAAAGKACGALVPTADDETPPTIDPDHRALARSPGPCNGLPPTFSCLTRTAVAEGASAQHRLNRSNVSLRHGQPTVLPPTDPYSRPRYGLCSERHAPALPLTRGPRVQQRDRPRFARL